MSTFSSVLERLELQASMDPKSVTHRIPLEDHIITSEPYPKTSPRPPCHGIPGGDHSRIFHSSGLERPLQNNPTRARSDRERPTNFARHWPMRARVAHRTMARARCREEETQRIDRGAGRKPHKASERTIFGSLGAPWQERGFPSKTCCVAGEPIERRTLPR